MLVIAILAGGLAYEYYIKPNQVLAEVNGMPGLLRYVNGELESVQSFETDGRHILRIHSQRNPDKLQNVRPL